MDKEVLFGKTLEELRRKAAVQGGYIDKNEILEKLAPLELDEEKTGMVFDYLKGRGIRFDITVSDNAIPAGDIELDGVTPSENEAVISEFALGYKVRSRLLRVIHGKESCGILRE